MFRESQKGLFWLLDKPDHMVDGTLNISDRVGLELTTHGLLDLVDNEGTPRTIRGATASGYVTLVEARTFRREDRLSRYLSESQENWFCRYAFRSESQEVDHLDEGIVSVEVEIQSLSDWAYEGRNLRLDWKNGALSWPVEPSGPTGRWSLGEIGIRHAFSTSTAGRGGHYSAVEVATKTSFVVRFDQPQSIKMAQDTVSSLQTLVSVAAGEAVAIERVSLTVNPGTLVERLLLHYEPVLRPTDPASQDSKLFTMDEFGGVEGVGRWLDSLCNQTILKNALLAARYRRPSFITDQTLHLLIACEAHQRHVENRAGSHMRLGDLLPVLDWVGQGFLDWIGNWKDWRARIRGIRSDQIAHLQSYGKATGDNEDIWTVNRQLYAFVVIRLLSHCGFSEDLVEGVVMRASSEAVMRVW